MASAPSSPDQKNPAPQLAELRHQKRDLRDAMLARRAAAHATGGSTAAQKLAANFLAADFLKALPQAIVISAYAAFGHEIDPSPLLHALHPRGYRLALPLMAGKTRPLEFRLYTPGQTLIANSFGVGEPDPAAPPIEPDLLLLPLLAFDRHYRRLGYGGGYYDRTLAILRSRKIIKAIGLAFACQEINAVPVTPHDAVMDGVVTESEKV